MLSTRVENLLRIQGEKMKALAVDYSQRGAVTRAYRQVTEAGGANPWPGAKLDLSLKTFDLDAVWVYDANGRLLHYGHSGVMVEALKHLPETAARNRSALPGRFFLASPAGPVEICAAPITVTDSAPGYFLIGQIWDKAREQELSDLLAADVSIKQAQVSSAKESGKTDAPEKPSARMTFRQDLRDADTQSVATLKVTSRYRGFEELNVALRTEIFGVAVFMVVLLSVLVLCGLQWIDRPMKAITTALEQQDPALVEQTLKPLLPTPGKPGAAPEFRNMAALILRAAEQSKALRASETGYRHIATNVPGVVYRIIRKADGSLELPFVSEGARRLFGMSPEELQQKPELLFHAVHPDDRSSFNVSVAEARIALHQWKWEGRFLLPSGELCWVRADAHPDPRENGDVEWNGLLIDITDTREAQTALQSQQEFLRNVLDSAPDFVFVKDRFGVYTLANRAMAEARGITPEEMIGKTDHDFGMDPEIVQEYLAADKRTLEALQDTFVAEEPLPLRDGRVRWLQTTKRPILPPGSSTYQVLGISTDITERKQAQERLQARERQLREAQENARIGSWELDITSGKLTWSEQTFHLFGFDPSVGEPDFETYVQRYPSEDRPMFQAAIQRAITEGTPFRFDRRITLADGSVRWLHATGRAVRDSEGRVVRLQGTAQDITERKRAEEKLALSEERFRSAIAAMQEGFVLLDSQGVIQLYNSAAERILGRQLKPWTLRPLPWQGWSALRADGSRWEEEAYPIFITLTEGRRIQGELMGIHRADGSIVWILISTAPLFHPGEDRPYAAVITFSDVTEMRALNQTLQQRNDSLKALAKELKRSNEALQDFAYIASHDLKEPLRKIQTFGDMLRHKAGDSLNPTTRDYADRMIAAAARMQALLTSLLTYSRASARPVTVGKVDLNEVAAGVLIDLEEQITQTEAQVSIGPLPVLQADARQMRQLLQNLIDNAIKFRRPEAPLQVTVTAATEEAEGSEEAQWIQLCVADNGMGFAPEYNDRIFNIFERLVTKEQGYDGTGIGLAICKKIVELHGGTIRAVGILGAGARFEVRLPVRPSALPLPD